METPDDFKELLELFNAHGVEYVVVGGFARAHHGSPRVTGDIDLFVRPNSENAIRILDALRDFGFGSLDLAPGDLEAPGRIVQLGYPPVRVDLLTSIAGVSWDSAWANKAEGAVAGVPTPFIGREDFIRSKLAAGRTQDLADVEAIGGELPTRQADRKKSQSGRPSKQSRKGSKRRSP